MKQTRNGQRAPSTKESYWRSEIQAWQKSGKTQVEHCRRNNVSLARFSFWKSKLKKRDAASKGSLPKRFFPVQVIPDLPCTGLFEIVLLKGRRIVVPRDGEASELRRLIEILEETP